MRFPRPRTTQLVLLGCLLVPSLFGCHSSTSGSDISGWRQTLARRLPEFGHRNWVVIADSAYPAQSRPGIETIVTDADQLDVVEAVLAALDHAPHVKPIVYTDAELQSVPESDAPGIEAYRQWLSEKLGNRFVRAMPHEEIIAKLDEAGQT